MTIDYSFDVFDKFHRKPFAERLTKVLTKFYPFYDEAFVLSINARFGSGKTTFLKMWKNYLENVHGIKVVYINAWETDFDAEPVIPIVSAILEYIEDKSALKELANKLKSVLGTVTLVGINALDHHTGINFKVAAEEVQKQLNEQNVIELGKAIFKEFSFKKDAYKQLRNGLEEYVATLEGKPFVIFVDELDRARPDYALNFLEAIKHIFSVKGVCFVLAVDKSQLECSAKQLYGNLDFENYYRRFITREATLHEPKDIDFHPFIDSLSKDFFDEKMESGVSFAFEAKDKNKILREISRTAQGFGMVPREIESFFRIFSQFMAVEPSDKFVKASWVEAAVLLIAISIKNPVLYRKIGNNLASPTEISKFLYSLNYDQMSDKNAFRYALIGALACSINQNNHDWRIEAADEMIRFERIDTTNLTDLKGCRDQQIGQLAKIMNNYSSLPEETYFRTIYNHIEEWRDFFTN